MSDNIAAPIAALEVLDDILALAVAARRLALKLEPESAAKEDLLHTLSSVEVAIWRVEIEDHADRDHSGV